MVHLSKTESSETFSKTINTTNSVLTQDFHHTFANKSIPMQATTIPSTQRNQRHLETKSNNSLTCIIRNATTDISTN